MTELGWAEVQLIERTPLRKLCRPSHSSPQATSLFFAPPNAAGLRASASTEAPSKSPAPATPPYPQAPQHRRDAPPSSASAIGFVSSDLACPCNAVPRTPVMRSTKCLIGAWASADGSLLLRPRGPASFRPRTSGADPIEPIRNGRGLVIVATCACRSKHSSAPCAGRGIYVDKRSREHLVRRVYRDFAEAPSRGHGP
ncbi:hypothetical protein GQ55_9G407800 [Panicum hallii var. hallii]|uniref:Uncharacterized protein n=2 Tax=Panicum hallii TaxID=206008 RepID=A0A2T7CA50_9POAL|nr:hypothetical protein GQ55_9G407800 [Panicum hallii var. hallii]